MLENESLSEMEKNYLSFLQNWSLKMVGISMTITSFIAKALQTVTFGKRW